MRTARHCFCSRISSSSALPPRFPEGAGGALAAAAAIGGFAGARPAAEARPAGEGLSRRPRPDAHVLAEDAGVSGVQADSDPPEVLDRERRLLRQRDHVRRTHRHAHGRARCTSSPTRSTADKLPAEKFFAPLAVISIDARAAKDADAVLSRWTTCSRGRSSTDACRPARSSRCIPAGDRAVGNAERFLNKDAKGTMHAPGFSEDVAHFLAKERDIVGAGVDTLSLDTASASKFVAHLALLRAREVRRRAAREPQRRPAVRRDDHRRRAEARGRVGRSRSRLRRRLTATSAAARSTSGSVPAPQLARSSLTCLHRGRAVVAGRRFRERVAAEERSDDHALVRVRQLLHVVDVARVSCRRGTGSSRCSTRRTPRPSRRAARSPGRWPPAHAARSRLPTTGTTPSRASSALHELEVVFRREVAELPAPAIGFEQQIAIRRVVLARRTSRRLKLQAEARLDELRRESDRSSRGRGGQRACRAS